jgi:hypothetical protein
MYPPVSKKLKEKCVFGIIKEKAMRTTEENYETVIKALSKQSGDVKSYSVFRNQDEVQIMIGDYALELKSNGKWKIS